MELVPKSEHVKFSERPDPLLDASVTCTLFQLLAKRSLPNTFVCELAPRLFRHPLPALESSARRVLSNAGLDDKVCISSDGIKVCIAIPAAAIDDDFKQLASQQLDKAQDYAATHRY